MCTARYVKIYSEIWQSGSEYKWLIGSGGEVYTTVTCPSQVEFTIRVSEKKIRKIPEKKTDIQESKKKGFEHIELPAKLLDYFLRSNKSNINESSQVEITIRVSPRHATHLSSLVHATFFWTVRRAGSSRLLSLGKTPRIRVAHRINAQLQQTLGNPLFSHQKSTWAWMSLLRPSKASRARPRHPCRKYTLVFLAVLKLSCSEVVMCVRVCLCVCDEHDAHVCVYSVSTRARREGKGHQERGGVPGGGARKMFGAGGTLTHDTSTWSCTRLYACRPVLMGIQPQPAILRRGARQAEGL